LVALGDGVEKPSGRGWLRAAGLTTIAFGLPVFSPAVLVAVPLILLLGVGIGGGRRALAAGAVAVLAALVVASGPRDGLWYVERAWAALLGGCFLAASLARPTWPVSRRALASVGVTTLVTVAYFVALGADAWLSVDWAVGSLVSSGVAASLHWLTLLSEGQAVSPALAATMYEWAERQILVFPALVSVASIAALGLSSWIVVRVVDGSDDGLEPFGGFRFNDHLVWLMITGLVLLVTRWSEVSTRIGWNATVFMGALYAARGAAVVTAIGRSVGVLVGVLLFVLLLPVAPVVLGAAVMVGIGDTWLDFRTRAHGPTA